MQIVLKKEVAPILLQGTSAFDEQPLHPMVMPEPSADDEAPTTLSDILDDYAKLFDGDLSVGISSTVLHPQLGLPPTSTSMLTD